MDPKQPAIVCPQCGKADKVQSAAAAHIASPIKPSDTPRTFIKVIRWIFGGMFGLVTSMLCVFLLGALLLGGCSTAVGTQYGDTTTAPLLLGLLGMSFLPALVVMPIGLLFMGAFTIGLPWLLFRYVDRIYKAKLAQWQRALSKYNHLYYCARDAGVFLEGQNRIIALEQMQAFLYEMQDSQPMWPLGG